MSESNDAKKAFVKSLTEISEALKAFGIDSRVMSHANRDGSVDAMLNITTIPKGVTLESVLEEIEENLTPPFKRAWSSIRMIRPAREDIESTSGQIMRGNRYVGITQTHWRRATRAKLPLMVIQAKAIDETARDKRRRKTEQVQLMYHWNEDGTRPPKTHG